MNRKHTGNKNASGCDKYVHYCFNEGDLFKIISYVFILDTTFSEENNKGIMLISEDENVFNKSNMYEYYYNKSLIPLIKGLFESNYSNE